MVSLFRCRLFRPTFDTPLGSVTHNKIYFCGMSLSLFKLVLQLIRQTLDIHFNLVFYRSIIDILPTFVCLFPLSLRATSLTYQTLSKSVLLVS